MFVSIGLGLLVWIGVILIWVLFFVAAIAGNM
jgi:hypothetical protein